MSDINDGGPAFPRAGYEDRRYGSAVDGDETVLHEDGMSLRDYFAGRAMQGIVGVLHQGIRPVDLEAMARDAYAIADAMLKARKGKA